MFSVYGCVFVYVFYHAKWKAFKILFLTKPN